MDARTKEDSMSTHSDTDAKTNQNDFFILNWSIHVDLDVAGVKSYEPSRDWLMEQIRFDWKSYK